jgi:hypothetical protein
MEFEIPIVLIVGFAAGYAAVISFVRRRKAYRLRHAEAL